MLNEECPQKTVEASTAVRDEAPVEFESSHTHEYYMIAREGKYALKEMLRSELSIMVEELLDEILSTLLYKAQ